MPLVISLVRAAAQGPRDERGWLVVCLAIGPILAFTLVAVSGNRVLYHWAAPGYLFAFALLGTRPRRHPAQSPKRARVWLASTAASLIVHPGCGDGAGATALAAGGLGEPADLPADRDGVLDRAQVGAVRGADCSPAPTRSSLATRWHEAARIDLALEGRMPVRCPCSDARGYGVIYRNAANTGQDALIVGERLTKAQAEARYAACFDSIEPLAPVTVHQAGAPIARATALPRPAILSARARRAVQRQRAQCHSRGVAERSKEYERPIACCGLRLAQLVAPGYCHTIDTATPYLCRMAAAK